MTDRRNLLLAIAAALVLASGSEAQGFDPRANFDDRGRGRGDFSRDIEREFGRGGERGFEDDRLSHDELRRIVSRRYSVREMRTSGECGNEFWALIITSEGHAQWVVLDVQDGRFLRTQSHAPACG